MAYLGSFFSALVAREDHSIGHHQKLCWDTTDIPPFCYSTTLERAEAELGFRAM